MSKKRLPRTNFHPLSSLPNTFRILCAGNWLPEQVAVHDSAQVYAPPAPHADRALAYWEKLTARGDQYLFNGELFHLENFTATHQRLTLHLGRTCYRDQIYHNAHAEELSQAFGARTAVRGLGVSALVITADDYLPIIRRGAHLGEEPGKLDVIGGHAHPDRHFAHGKPDLFRAILEELETELNLPAAAVRTLVCCGLVENLQTAKPDLVFYARVRSTMAEIEKERAAAVEADEITALLAVPHTAAAIRQHVATNRDELTPSARACMQLLADSWLPGLG